MMFYDIGVVFESSSLNFPPNKKPLLRLPSSSQNLCQCLMKCSSMSEYMLVCQLTLSFLCFANRSDLFVVSFNRCSTLRSTQFFKRFLKQKTNELNTC